MFTLMIFLRIFSILEIFLSLVQLKKTKTSKWKTSLFLSFDFFLVVLSSVDCIMRSFHGFSRECCFVTEFTWVNICCFRRKLSVFQWKTSFFESSEKNRNFPAIKLIEKSWQWFWKLETELNDNNLRPNVSIYSYL